MLNIDEIKARLRAASPGPWVADQANERILGPDDDELFQLESWPSKVATADLEFVAHARADIEALLAEVERLRAEREACAKLVGNFIGVSHRASTT